MTEYPSDLEKRAEASPIHQWAGGFQAVERYLDGTQIPVHFKEPVHEVLIVRGDYPVNMQPLDEQGFQNSAMDVYQQFKVPPQLTPPVHMIALELIRQWKAYKNSQN